MNGEPDKDLLQGDAFNVHQDWWESVNPEYAGFMLTDRELDLVRAASASAWNAGVDWRAKQDG